MMGQNLFSLIALVPLALNVAAPGQGAVLMPMCTGGGTVILIPLGTGGAQPGKSDNGCCIKGCHTGVNRKKMLKRIEAVQ